MILRVRYGGWLRSAVWAGAWLWIAARGSSLSGQEQKGSEFFEAKIRPVLVEHCYKCHSAQAATLKGNLRLDYRDGLLRGGETGPSVVPGKPDESLLIQALRHES